MTIITLDEIQQNPARYLQQVKTGETLVIVENGELIAEIRPITENGASLRPYGLNAGEFRVPDDFDAPLPDELLKLFEG